MHHIVYQDVETEKFEAVTRIRHILFKCLINVRLSGDNRLDHDVLNLFPDGQIVDSDTLHEFA